MQKLKIQQDKGWDFTSFELEMEVYGLFFYRGKPTVGEEIGVVLMAVWWWHSGRTVVGRWQMLLFLAWEWKGRKMGFALCLLWVNYYWCSLILWPNFIAFWQVKPSPLSCIREGKRGVEEEKTKFTTFFLVWIINAHLDCIFHLLRRCFDKSKREFC